MLIGHHLPVMHSSEARPLERRLESSASRLDKIISAIQRVFNRLLDRLAEITIPKEFKAVKEPQDEDLQFTIQVVNRRTLLFLLPEGKDLSFLGEVVKKEYGNRAGRIILERLYNEPILNSRAKLKLYELLRQGRE